MATMPIEMTQTVRGTQVKKALQFLKAYRVKGRNNIPILEYVQVKGDQWRVTDLHTEAIVDAPIDLPGGIYDLISVMPALTAAPIDVQIDGDKVVINGVPLVRERDTDDLPQFDYFHADRAVDLGPLPQEWSLLQSHAAKEESRPILKGIFLSRDNEEFVSTDGSRLSRVAHPALQHLPADCVIPNVPIKDKQVNLGVFFDGTQPIRVEFAGELGTVRTRPLEGMYPDYVRVFPTWDQHQLRCQVNRDQLLDWAKRVTDLAKGNRSMSADIISGDVSIEYGTANIGALTDLATDRLQPTTELGTDWARGQGTILVNPQWIVDVAKGMPKGSTITVGIVGKQSPIGFYAADLQSIVMPLRQLQ